MYRGDQGRENESSTPRRDNEEIGKERCRDGRGNDDSSSSRRRRSRNRHDRTRSRSSSRNRHRRKHGRKSHYQYSSSSSSNSNSPERPSLKTTSVSVCAKEDLDRRYQHFQNPENPNTYRPPIGIFEKESDLELRYSSGVNMEAPVSSRAADDTEFRFGMGITPKHEKFENREFYNSNDNDRGGPPSGGISMRLNVPLKEPPRIAQYGAAAPSTLTNVTPRVGSIYTKPTKLVTQLVPTLPSKSSKVASVFNIDDDEEEEMPPEAKMRMKNVGRDTPTSAGPNSFGKTKIGFCNVTHIAEKKLEGSLAKKLNPTKK